ncbi:hypothetical protein [Luteimonas mephitis]|uniref:hypothetical protein n=1 Tax=Luteimonas mephitis TaxID=83615 RepID=UPI003A8DE599
MTPLPAAVALAALLALAAAAQAQAADLLSGSYRPAGEPAAPDMPAPLRIEANSAGWTAWFEGRPQPMQEMGWAGLAKLFPGVAGGHEIQCGATGRLVFCHVPRGTPLPESDAVSSTGYFTADTNGGVYELERLP